jgi:hypothetical protein
MQSVNYGARYMNLMHRVDTFLRTMITQLNDLPGNISAYEREVIELLFPVFYKSWRDEHVYFIHTPEIHSVGETDLKNASRGTFSVVGTSYGIEDGGLLAVLVIDRINKRFRAVSKGAYNLAELKGVSDKFYDKNRSTGKQLLHFTCLHDLGTASTEDKQRISDDFATFLDNCNTARSTKYLIIEEAEFNRLYNRKPSLLERLVPPPNFEINKGYDNGPDAST